MCRNSTRILRDLFKKARSSMVWGDIWVKFWDELMKLTIHHEWSKSKHKLFFWPFQPLLTIFREEVYPYKVIHSFIWLLFLWFLHNRTYFNRQWYCPDPPLWFSAASQPTLLLVKLQVLPSISTSSTCYPRVRAIKVLIHAIKIGNPQWTHT